MRSLVVCVACATTHWTRVPPRAVERMSRCPSCRHPTLEVIATEPDAFDDPDESRFDRTDPDG
jgi:hypothetical protein